MGLSLRSVSAGFQGFRAQRAGLGSLTLEGLGPLGLMVWVKAGLQVSV